jgi:TolB-like protein
MMRALAAALLLLGACASQQDDFVTLSYEAADALLEEMQQKLPDDATIIYGVFTPVGQPSTSSPFGQIFAEQVASRLAQNGVGVVEVRLRETLAVREGGPYALSDDVRDVARRVQARAALSGSYAVTSGYVLVAARVIDVTSGLVVASWDKYIRLGVADYALFDMAPPEHTRRR